MLIVLRGNAASGKSTVARLLQERLDSPAAILSQDLFRRGKYAKGRTGGQQQGDPHGAGRLGHGCSCPGMVGEGRGVMRST